MSQNVKSQNQIVKFFWKSAGADEDLLMRCSYSDRVKYFCLGGVIISTAVMATLAGGYAFYTIFSPKGGGDQQMVDVPTHIPTVILSTIFGFIWGLIIYNIDRFIVTSTGKGDGTEKITWDEFKGAIPRIIMGAIIALTISKPVEIRMFEKEINAKLYQEKNKEEQRLDSITTSKFAQKLLDSDSSMRQYTQGLDRLIKRKEKLEKDRTTELMSGATGHGDGPVAKALEAQINAVNAEIDDYNKTNEILRKNATERKNELQKEKDAEMEQNHEVAAGLDGLAERIILAEEIAGPTMSLFITLLFMVIELTPIFFKLMLTKSSYDYLKDNQDDITKAENGIEVKYDYYEDRKGQEKNLVINHVPKFDSLERVTGFEIQEELLNYAKEKFIAQEKAKIDADPGAYIQTQNTGNGSAVSGSVVSNTPSNGKDLRDGNFEDA